MGSSELIATMMMTLTNPLTLMIAGSSSISQQTLRNPSTRAKEQHSRPRSEAKPVGRLSAQVSPTLPASSMSTPTTHRRRSNHCLLRDLAVIRPQEVRSHTRALPQASQSHQRATKSRHNSLTHRKTNSESMSARAHDIATTQYSYCQLPATRSPEKSLTTSVYIDTIATFLRHLRRKVEMSHSTLHHKLPLDSARWTSSLQHTFRWHRSCKVDSHQRQVLFRLPRLSTDLINRAGSSRTLYQSSYCTTQRAQRLRAGSASAGRHSKDLKRRSSSWLHRG